MTGAGGQFVFDTLLATGLLIAAVLALRAPAARWFGPHVAYALWALPFLRLFMPPLLLPSSMAPSAPDTASDAPVLLVNDVNMCSFMSTDKLDQLIDGLKSAEAK